MIKDKRQEIEELRRQVEGRLEELRMRYYKNHYNNEIDRIIDGLKSDKALNAKKIVSFDLLDKLLDCCQSGFCPPLDSVDQVFLLGISMSEYIKEKSKEYCVLGDERGRQTGEEIAEKRAKCIFECQLKPNFTNELFSRDMEGLVKGGIEEDASRRRAYLRYLESAAKGGMDPVESMSEGTGCNNRTIPDLVSEKMTIDKCRVKWEKSLDEVNGVDMFRFCCIREMLDPTQEGKANGLS